VSTEGGKPPGEGEPAGGTVDAGWEQATGDRRPATGDRRPGEASTEGTGAEAAGDVAAPVVADQGVGTPVVADQGLVPPALPVMTETAEPAVPEPDYAAEAARWRDELQAAVGLAEEAERKEEERGRRKKEKNPAGGGGEPKPPRGGGEGGEGPGWGRWKPLLIGGGVVLAVILMFVALGKWNARDYYLVCNADRITAERGRGFPPWGTHRLTGAEWEPIQIPPDAECQETQTTDLIELEDAYLTALVEQANGMLTSRNPSNIELAERQLGQALLLTRRPERRNQRKEIERLLGDVEYWRGAAQIQQVIDLLRQAAGRFDGAAIKRPRHKSDSSSWAGFARATAEELRLGPPELRPAHPVAPNAPPPFTGTGPDSPVQVPDAGVGIAPDAGPGTLLPPPTDARPAPPDAGLPSGGVLL